MGSVACGGAVELGGPRVNHRGSHAFLAQEPATRRRTSSPATHGQAGVPKRGPGSPMSGLRSVAARVGCHPN